jgi:hypothetical protein
MMKSSLSLLSQTLKLLIVSPLTLCTFPIMTLSLLKTRMFESPNSLAGLPVRKSVRKQSTFQ